MALTMHVESDSMYDGISPSRDNPRLKANIFSQLIFAWMMPLLYRGSKQGLKTEDLPKCLPDDESELLGDKLEKNWQEELLAVAVSKRQPSLRRALWKTFWSSALLDGSICFFYIMLKSLIPLLLAQLLTELQIVQDLPKSSNITELTERFISDTKLNNTFSNTNTKSPILGQQLKVDMVRPWQDIYILGSLLVGFTFIGCIINHHVDQRQKRMGAKMRIACCSLIQRKTTKLSLKTSHNISRIGHIVNLISNDVNRLDNGFVFVHYLWILPIQTLLISYLIWQRLGYAAIIGVTALLFQTIPMQMCLSSWTATLRQRVAQRTDSRIGKMNELIRGIQVIKMYAWESCFREVIKECRRREIRETRKAAYLRSFYLSSMILPERLTLFITIVTAVKMGTLISADVIFAIANLYHVLQLVAGIFCPMAISFASEAFVSIERIEKFLMQPEKEINKRSLPDSQNALEIQNVTASWDVKVTLKNISLKVAKGKLCVIVGPVGSGKSSLLQLILGELNADQGNIKVDGNISYASQEPWLFNGTIKKNILFTLPYCHKHYQKVVEACSLVTDFQQLKYQDATVVGERGASLSGGQKARINLARAVYNNAELYLFDDPLSAVDSNVGRNLYDKIIGSHGLLQHKTRILVTHQTQYITEEADLIVCMEDGYIKSGNWQTMRDAIHVVVNKPNRISEIAAKQPSLDEHNTRDQDTFGECDALLNGQHKKYEVDNGKEESGQLIAEDQGGGCVKASIWWAYFHAGNNMCGLIYIIFILLISQAICSGADYFVNIYTKIIFMEKQQHHNSLISENVCLTVYSLLIATAVFMVIYRCYLFLKTCMHASKILHDRMFGCILKATMRFFDSNPSGRILNRFSKDMGAIDETLPRFMSEFTHLALVMLGVLVVICIINFMLLIAVALVVSIDFMIIKLYLRSSQDLKRLEGIRRSPVFSHISATLSGLTTIRCRKREATMIEEFDNLQDIHSSAYHLTLSSNTALGLWLDCANVLILLNSVIFSFILLNQDTYSGHVGLAITQAMMLTGMVQYGLRQLGEAFQQMTSVERILEYTKLEGEKFVGYRPPGKWPINGVVEYKNVNVRYHKQGQLVLKDINFKLASGWKVGIVGRTGAGKTSLISSLFRLCDYITGNIFIDDQDTSQMDLSKLRSSISIIPQEPVLFEGTIRYNLDPFNKYEDSDMWQAFKSVQLSRDLSLDFVVSEFGNNLSIGQRQLICLARALLGKNSILVMDEATANVDQKTDHHIQETINKNFSHCTVITVAHRLKTVMKSDRIMVLDNGEMKEFDIPYKLLQKPNGLLKQMVEATGNEASSLTAMAKEYYNEKG